MQRRFQVAAAVLALALLAQPLAVVAECLTMPERACPAPGQEMHCAPAAQLQAQDRGACCDLRSAPAALSKAPAVTPQLAATALLVKTPAPVTAPVVAPAFWTLHGPPQLQETSQAQALLCVFLI